MHVVNPAYIKRQASRFSPVQVLSFIPKTSVAVVVIQMRISAQPSKLQIHVLQNDCAAFVLNSIISPFPKPRAPPLFEGSTTDLGSES
jgi:hypothetical protein